MRLELANRREFDIQVQADSEAIIRDITLVIQAKDAEQRRYIKQQVEMGVGQAKKELVEQARQAELAKRNSR